jgi:hypothetical protein
MLGGQRIHLILLPVIYSCGAISNQRCIHTELKIFQALKDTIRREIAAIPTAMTERVMQASRNRLEECITNDGHHLGDIIFKT